MHFPRRMRVKEERQTVFSIYLGGPEMGGNISNDGPENGATPARRLALSMTDELRLCQRAGRRS